VEKMVLKKSFSIPAGKAVDKFLEKFGVGFLVF